jgi:hypothetical protein
MSPLQENLNNRRWLLDRLRAEIIGPDLPQDHGAIPLELGQETVFKSWDAWRLAKIQPGGEEILWQDPPIKRYGAGVLFPVGITEQRHLAEDANTTPLEGGEVDPVTDARADEILEEKLRKKTGTSSLVDDSDSHEVTLANAYRPSALGISFLANLNAESDLMQVTVSFAQYIRQSALISRQPDDEGEPFKRELWFRLPGKTPEGVDPVITVPHDNLLKTGRIEAAIPGHEEKGLRVVVVSRASPDDEQARLITVCLVNNEEKDAGRLDERCFFQCGIRVSGGSKTRWILPYPEPESASEDPCAEENITRLLYRDRQTYAIGHGCGADWESARSLEGPASRVSYVQTDCLPEFETQAMSADIKDADGSDLRVSMRKLAGLDPDDDGFGDLERLTKSYSDWLQGLQNLDDIKAVIDGVPRPPIPGDLKETARELLSRCNRCLRRIERGLAFLRKGDQNSLIAVTAFRLMNKAMLVSQLRASREARTPTWDAAVGRIVWDRILEDPDPKDPHTSKGYWRPFQIAFILMSLPGICDPEEPERSEVDLIWFPTGGGKTEAYLGLTAFTLIFNRLSGRRPGGADILMRYTLRLLTAQQFQRAGLLFCSLERVRLDHLDEIPALGREEFRIGMWVGGQATPNSRANATRALRNLQKDPQYGENPFVLLKCPWCNGRFGPVMHPPGASQEKGKGRGKPGQDQKTVYGYKNRFLPGCRKQTVVFQCDDIDCEYSNRPLPIVVIDEDIYDNPPSLVIATVDKFAMLAWKPDIRRLLGIDDNGERIGAPPSLIIQDELHLISGPLGSMVGAYETVIDELCTDQQATGATLAPKIIASTATISRAEEQVLCLYARPHVNLFPPSGLEAGDSFFAREARDGDGALAPGRLYAGVMAPAHGSQQTTQARVFAALLQYPVIMQAGADEAETRDPWWTLLAFFNSLRELGGAATLLVADTCDYLRVIIDRHGFSYKLKRQLINVEELTSRIRSDQIPLAIQKLEAPFSRDSKGHVRDTVEACLASNIIEVGVDIDRLSLMTIVGQPKTTSQYIQVSSRIGRKLDAPGLVVITYSQSKPRDRSHYERFRSYHDRLYAQVEPTSVTPFSPPAVDRALHGVLVSAVRQLTPPDVARVPRPCPVIPGTAIRSSVERMFDDRVQQIDPAERDSVMDTLARRFREWQAWNPKEYGRFGPPPPDPPLMYPAGSTGPVEWKGHSWPTLTSLRDVDASCEAEVTRYYLDSEAQEEEP